MSKVCPKDGCEYTGNEHGLKVHFGRSEDHSGTLSDKYYECELCGEQSYCNDNRDPRCCSIECRNARNYGSIANYWFEKVDICEYCGDVFEHSPTKDKTYCSRKCADEDKKLKGKVKGENNSKYVERVKVNCAECGSQLKRTQRRVERSTKHYCSIKCRGAGHHGGLVKIDELDMYVRSSWEKEFVLELENRDINYEYEKRFQLENRVYSPDFMIDDIVIEIKGVSRPDDLDRSQEFMDEHPEYEYIVLQGNGERLPADKWYSWDERDIVFEYLATSV